MIDNTNQSSIAELATTLDTQKIHRRLKAHSQQLAPRSLLLIISPLDGKELPALLSNGIPEGSIMLGVCFNTLHNQEYNSKKIPHVSSIPLAYGDTLEHTIFTLIQEHDFKSVDTIYYSHEAYNYKEEAKLLQEKCLIEIKQKWTNHVSNTRFGMLWLKNIIVNLSTQSIPKPHTDSLKLSYHTNTVAIVVGAGPSLSPAVLHFIKKHQDTCCIFAVDTAMPILHKYGITPQFCVLLEGQFYNMQDFIPPPSDRTIAIADICCYPQSLHIFKELRYVSSVFSPISFFNDNKTRLPIQVPPLGSVGVLAPYIAIHSRPSHMLFAGLDFSYYRGKSHATHSPSYKVWQQTHNTLLPWQQACAHFQNNNIMPTSCNTKVEDPVLQMFRNMLENRVLPLAKQYNITCLDLNPQSIIRGIEPITLPKADTIVKNSKPYTQNKLKTSHSPTDSKKILDLLLTQCTYTKTLMKELSSKKVLPQASHWKRGLDNFAFILKEDPYLVKTSLSLWQSNNLYSKIFIIADQVALTIKKYYL